MLAVHRSAAAAVFAGIVAAAGPAAAAQDDYPNHAIKLIVPFGAGGPGDIFSRQVAQFLPEILKQPVVSDNRPGAASIIGADAAAKSAPDGYTLLTISNTLTANETLFPRRPYVLMRDFVPVASLNYSDLVMVVHPSVPANNLAEFIALAKSKPGQLSYASAGIGTPYHMAAELFKKMTGTDILHVPHRASGDQRNAVIGGHLDMTFDAIPTMASNVQAGQVRALGTSAATRSKVLPDVPTIAEAGVPGFEAVIWIGIVAPAGTPKPIVDKLNAAINETIARPEIVSAWEHQGANPMPMTPDEFDAFLRKDIEKWAQVAKFAGTVGQ
ncbi:MAG: tripartite tricarboxylate transporter substrate binding protein [Alphaproteobacteria bacterium]|nr:tripartite tricarboxylate transporter substrate binding protein [Alphaproteobacteria bacterium]